jgi:hypothetical protein
VTLADKNLYEAGLELAECPKRGWVVYTSVSGEDPDFCAFFLSEHEALHFRETYRDEEGEPLFDSAIELAILTPHGIVTANDFRLNTHELLAQRIAETE